MRIRTMLGRADCACASGTKAAIASSTSHFLLFTFYLDLSTCDPHVAHTGEPLGNFLQENRERRRYALPCGDELIGRHTEQVRALDAFAQPFVVRRRAEFDLARCACPRVGA